MPTVPLSLPTHESTGGVTSEQLKLLEVGVGCRDQVFLKSGEVFYSTHLCPNRREWVNFLKFFKNWGGAGPKLTIYL